MRGLVAEAGLSDEIEIESAGTGDWHVGHPPDERSVAAAAERGVELSKDEAREAVYGMPYDEWKARHQTERAEAVRS